MNRDEAFDAWAPKGASWSRWVKPTLFTFADTAVAEDFSGDDPRFVDDIIALESEEIGRPHRASARTRNIAIIVDLPGASSVRAGAAMAAEGFFPVPLFNSVPHASGVVDMQLVVNALVAAVPARRSAGLSPASPPVFLLDARRAGKGAPLRPGRFDNRAAMFETDFPSASTLLAQGLKRVVVVHREGIAPDLVDMLARWQKSGIAVHEKNVIEPGAPVPVAIRSLSMWTRIAQWFTRNGLRRGSDGSFGGMIPHPSAG